MRVRDLAQRVSRAAVVATFEDEVIAYAQDKLMRTGIQKSGKQLDPFMPIESWRNLNDVEMHAIWAYLRTVPPMVLGSR